MLLIIKEFFIVLLVFALIKFIMVLCRPVREILSSIILNIGKGVIYAATAVIVLPKRIVDKSSTNVSENNDDMPFMERINKFFKSIVAEVVKLIGIVYMHNKVDYSICPNCFTKYTEPRYICPKCGTVYHSLEPSNNGIFNIECSCGYKIPVTAFGKRKLKTLCPTCGKENPIPEVSAFVVVVVGGTGSGKSTFIENSNLKKVSTGKEIFYETIIEDEKGKEKHIMVVETDGEDFISSENLKKHKYYEYNSAFIFIIDAFAICNAKNFNNEAYTLSDMLDTTILNLQKNYDLKPGEMIQKPIAVVLAKNDALDKVNIKKEPERILAENGEEVFINKIHNNFIKYKFFKTNLRENAEIINWITRNM